MLPNTVYESKSGNGLIKILIDSGEQRRPNKEGIGKTMKNHEKLKIVILFIYWQFEIKKW